MLLFSYSDMLIDGQKTVDNHNCIKYTLYIYGDFVYEVVVLQDPKIHFTVSSILQL